MKIVINNSVRLAFLAACAALMFLAFDQRLQAAGKKAMPPPASGVELLKIVEMVEPEYPPGLTLDGVVRGTVDVVFGIDEQGRLDDYLVTSYSRREFVKSVEAVLGKWKFEPMRIDGEGVWSRAQLSFFFEAQGVVITRYALDGVTMLTGSMLEDSRRVSVLSKQSQLDRPLVVRRAVVPLYPTQLAENRAAGKAMVEFFVDEQGRVRLPIVEANDHPWFGASAAQAVLQWQFEPPMKDGSPTVVKARQEFLFNP